MSGCFMGSTAGCPGNAMTRHPGDGTIGCLGMSLLGACGWHTWVQAAVHPPDGHGILAVDLLHGLDVGIQLRVTVQVGGAGPLQHSTPQQCQPRAQDQAQAGES